MAHRSDEPLVLQFRCVFLLERVEDSRLQSGKREIEIVGIEHRAGEFFRQSENIGRGMFRTERIRTLGDSWAARVGEAEELGNFIEGFAGGIILRLAEHLILEVILHQHQLRMSAGNDECEQGKSQFRIFTKQVGIDMAFEMLDADERFLPDESERLGGTDADEERGHEPRPLGHGDEIDIRRCQMGTGHRFLDDRNNVLDVFARSKIGHDAAPYGMERRL